MKSIHMWNFSYLNVSYGLIVYGVSFWQARAVREAFTQLPSARVPSSGTRISGSTWIRGSTEVQREAHKTRDSIQATSGFQTCPLEMRYDTKQSLFPRIPSTSYIYTWSGIRKRVQLAKALLVQLN